MIIYCNNFTIEQTSLYLSKPLNLMAQIPEIGFPKPTFSLYFVPFYPFKANNTILLFFWTLMQKGSTLDLLAPSEDRVQDAQIVCPPWLELSKA